MRCSGALLYDFTNGANFLPWLLLSLQLTADPQARGHACLHAPRATPWDRMGRTGTRALRRVGPGVCGVLLSTGQTAIPWECERGKRLYTGAQL
jgi:hypothetical protein